MKGYKVYQLDSMGYEEGVTYIKDYNIAIKHFNLMIIDQMKKLDCIKDKYDFQEVTEDFKEGFTIFREGLEIIAKRAPYMIYKQGKRLTAAIYYSYKCSYEYDEYDVDSQRIIIEEIEIID